MHHQCLPLQTTMMNANHDINSIPTTLLMPQEMGEPARASMQRPITLDARHGKPSSKLVACTGTRYIAMRVWQCASTLYEYLHMIMCICATFACLPTRTHIQNILHHTMLQCFIVHATFVLHSTVCGISAFYTYYKHTCDMCISIDMYMYVCQWSVLHG